MGRERRMVMGMRRSERRRTERKGGVREGRVKEMVVGVELDVAYITDWVKSDNDMERGVFEKWGEELRGGVGSRGMCHTTGIEGGG